MRMGLLLVGFFGLILAGCGGKTANSHTINAAPAKKAGSDQNSQPIVTPGGALPGKVVSVNPNGRFAVLRFSLGEMPALQQKMGVFRAGLKVGEIRISGPQRDTHTVADVTAGDCRVGDEVRAE